ncbi:MAG: hypothetical protein GY844_11520 [Bradyrhizobium sp.]|uniref:Calcineurin-like phosphoesterase domain-containing protein n=1 Tax=Afipia broomeae ATCC 49717 TaxID=883078 RepID=K8P4B1_9BRAD|nr:hypothetical protein [Afipia broomeae]EKS34520.1 hypothetical protein HMPREF9695_04430 [Afipia broomeae ATCC 49717]MCP4617053.1 hypothetical protein [Bradyrhizobium sp.]
MKIQIFSDLHCDVAPTKPIVIGNDVEVVVAAGDIAEGAKNAPAFDPMLIVEVGA